MSLERLFQRIAAYTALDAPVGFEEPVLRRVRDELQPVCERMEVDVRGNVYGYRSGVSADAPRVMITAHADEIGLMITSLLPGGFLRFTKLGHPTDSVLPGQRVRVHTTAGPLEAVIGVKPGHILSGDEVRRVPPLGEMYIDVGATSAEQAAEWGIEPGTPVTFAGALTRTQHPTRCFGKCVDNRAGVVSVLEIAERLQNEQVAAECVFVIVVEEEVGLRGAEVAARRVQPDVVLAIDTVPSGGTPDLRADELPWEIGRGPLLKVRETKGLSTHGPLRNLIRETAREHDLPHQLIVDTAGITDATSAQQASGDVAAMVLGLARRYSHSAVEMFDLQDVETLIQIAVRSVVRLTDRKQLQRI